MLSILFWNVNKKDLRNLVCDAVNAVSADVVVLLESRVTTSQTLESLQVNVSADFVSPPATLGRFQLFSRDAALDLHEVYTGNRVSLRRLRYGETDLLFGIVHLVDRRNWDAGNQSVQVTLLAQEIRRQEENVGHNRTVLVGDFNMNPFDQAMNMAPGMNAMMTIKCVERGSRTLDQQEYPFFYNPMWGLFGDRTLGPAGTFYHSVSSQGFYGWNMLDQVLVRPDALEWFGDVEILASAGATSLRTPSERPRKATASDHLPILLRLREEKNELLAKRH